jgi:hypothetical protein
MSLSARTGERVQSSTILSNCLCPVGIRSRAGMKLRPPPGWGSFLIEGKDPHQPDPVTRKAKNRVRTGTDTSF